MRATTNTSSKYLWQFAFKGTFYGQPKMLDRKSAPNETLVEGKVEKITQESELMKTKSLYKISPKAKNYKAQTPTKR